MKVLVVGQGAREHTLVWKIAQSPHVEKIYCIPGNPGIAELADCRPISLENGFADLADFAESEKIELTVVGPEAPLVAGIVDVFQARGLRAFGPDGKAALLEGSKNFAKELMAANGIPTAMHQTFDNPDAAIDYIKAISGPVFVKADGLARGQGAIPGRTVDDAIQAVRRIMVERAFGDAGSIVVIEEELIGEEASFTVLTDGIHCVPLVSSQDHKMSLDGDKGKNTGGMGAYSPAPVITPELHEQVMEEIVYPTVNAMRTEGRPFTGVLYVGLMIGEAGPKVVEYNCRFGDPETQVLLPRMESDLVPALEACITGTLADVEVEWKSKVAACVVMAPGGYPDNYETGKVITGLDRANALEDVTVFHAGTKSENGNIVTGGGRTLAITAVAPEFKSAIDLAYRGVGEIDFEAAHYRKDIGYRALARSGAQ